MDRDTNQLPPIEARMVALGYALGVLQQLGAKYPTGMGEAVADIALRLQNTVTGEGGDDDLDAALVEIDFQLGETAKALRLIGAPVRQSPKARLIKRASLDDPGGDRNKRQPSDENKTHAGFSGEDD